jgi:hypothetical protein
MHIFMLVTGMLQMALLWTAAPTAAGAVSHCLLQLEGCRSSGIGNAYAYV